MRINGWSYSIASALRDALSPWFTRLFLAGPVCVNPIFMGSPSFADSVLLSPPVRNVKATLQASLIFFPDILLPSFLFLSRPPCSVCLACFLHPPSSPPFSSFPLQPSLSSPFESGFPLGSALTPAVGWPFLTDIAALSCAIASLPRRRRHQRK